MLNCYRPVESGSSTSEDTPTEMEALMSDGHWYWTGKVKRMPWGIYHQYRNEKTGFRKWVYVGS